MKGNKLPDKNFLMATFAILAVAILVLFYIKFSKKETVTEESTEPKKKEVIEDWPGVNLPVAPTAPQKETPKEEPRIPPPTWEQFPTG